MEEGSWKLEAGIVTLTLRWNLVFGIWKWEDRSGNPRHMKVSFLREDLSAERQAEDGTPPSK